jgi:hypothetical protein
MSERNYTEIEIKRKILATWEAEIRGSWLEVHLGK